MTSWLFDILTIPCLSIVKHVNYLKKITQPAYFNTKNRFWIKYIDQNRFYLTKYLQIANSGSRCFLHQKKVATSCSGAAQR